MLIPSELIVLHIISKAVSGGALFYIAVVEIVSEQFVKGSPTLPKFQAFVAGILLIVVTTGLFDDQ